MSQKFFKFFFPCNAVVYFFIIIIHFLTSNIPSDIAILHFSIETGIGNICLSRHKYCLFIWLSFYFPAREDLPTSSHFIPCILFPFYHERRLCIGTFVCMFMSVITNTVFVLSMR